ncbi:restriction endonuclease subunit S [Mycoplasma todarodis]|uniref:restriction endonuclease subunit S n=1 Tax=Mycoplasma todarodis TaxID=1937191 RepID=UPI00103B3D85|nr:restriction endonuclease subunit S [Mycoplasma todarodis]
MVSENFVSTENMDGHCISSWKSGKGKQFIEEDILMSNIRPYFNKVWFATRKGTHSGDVLNFKLVRNDLIIKKYLFFIIASPTFNAFWNNTSKGTKMPRGDKQAMLEYEVSLPSIQEQQKIIDIIEPMELFYLNNIKCVSIDSVEHVKKDLKNLIDIIKPIETLEKKVTRIIKLTDKIPVNLMNLFGVITDEKYTYYKGSLPSKEIIDPKTLFLNVSAANGKFNRFVDNEKNIFAGDVMLSLDGNTGLVNNSLEGFNGYLYKVSHDRYLNCEVYYSLKTKINQDIIKANETGTTIKHSSNSKNEIKHIEYKWDSFKGFYDVNIEMKQTLAKLRKLKEKLLVILM